MSRIKWLLPLLLLLCSPTRAAVNVVGHCDTFNGTLNATNTLVCSIPGGGGSGHKMILAGELESASSYTVTCTETCTCPAGAAVNANFSGFIHNLFECYVDSASSSNPWTFTITVNGVGAGARGGLLEGWDVTGLASGADTSAITGVNNAKTVNFTTTSPNELAWSLGTDNINGPSIFAAGSNKEIGMVWGTDGYAIIDMLQTTTTATTYTANYTSTTSVAVQMVVVIPYTPSGGTSPPAVNIVQRCSAIGGFSIPGCSLTGVLNKMVETYSGEYPSAANTGTSVTACPAGTFVSHNYSGINFTGGICYSDGFTGNQAPSITSSGFNAFEYNAYEVSGLNNGIDAGSETAIVGQSGTFTAASNNEWAITMMLDNGANVMTPGNSFTALNNGFDNDSCCSSGRQQTLNAFLAGVTSGSHSVSYTMTSSTVPVMSIAAFGQSAVPTGHHHSQVF